MTDIARPFVIRAECLQGVKLPAGEPFTFTVTAFDVKRFEPSIFTEALEVMANCGLGSEHVPCSLTGLTWTPREFRLAAPTITEDSELQVNFLTPLELRSQAVPIMEPLFSVLIARLRDRITTFQHFYGESPLDVDFAHFTDIANHVQLLRSDLVLKAARRFSTRTRQWHPLNGFTGTAVYKGPWRSYEDWLRLGEWTGVGKQTSFGKGVFRILSPPDVLK